MFNQVGGNSTMNMNGAHAPPSEDRYAALKDLDSLMKQTQLKEETTGGTLSAWNANNSNSEYRNDTKFICLLTNKSINYVNCRVIFNKREKKRECTRDFYNFSTKRYVEHRRK